MCRQNGYPGQMGEKPCSLKFPKIDYFIELQIKMPYSPLKFLLGVLGILHTPSPHCPHANQCPAQLEIIGAGLSKTGTQSTKIALESLGYVIYNVESMMYYDHLDLVTQIYQSDTPEVRHERISELHDNILATGSTVVLDIPCNFLYKELSELSPDAEVLLTVRDTAQKWTKSVQKTFHAFAPLIGWPYSWFFDLETYSRLIWSEECNHDVDIWEPWFMPWVRIAHRYYMIDEAKCRNMYRKHWAEVEESIDPDRLTIYNVKHGWPPLLRLTNHSSRISDLPQFPKVNQQADMNVINFLTRVMAYTYPFFTIFGTGLAASFAYYIIS